MNGQSKYPYVHPLLFFSFPLFLFLFTCLIPSTSLSRLECVHTWKGKPKGSKQEHGVRLLVYKILDKELVKFCSITESKTSVTFKSNKRYKLKSNSDVCLSYLFLYCSNDIPYINKKNIANEFIYHVLWSGSPNHNTIGRKVQKHSLRGVFESHPLQHCASLGSLSVVKYKYIL